MLNSENRLDLQDKSCHGSHHLTSCGLKQQSHVQCSEENEPVSLSEGSLKESLSKVAIWFLWEIDDFCGNKIVSKISALQKPFPPSPFSKYFPHKWEMPLDQESE